MERGTVEECLRIAFQAPNGSNLQLYNWVLVDDPARRDSMAEIYRAGMDDRIADSRHIASTPSAHEERIRDSVFYLRDHLHEVPVLAVPTIAGRLEGASTFEQASMWGSVIPAVWSFMLALRSRRMGSAWTTVHLYREKQMAELLGIPYERVTQVGLFPVAYTVGTDFRPADRSRSERAIRWNRW